MRPARPATPISVPRWSTGLAAAGLAVLTMLELSAAARPKSSEERQRRKGGIQATGGGGACALKRSHLLASVSLNRRRILICLLSANQW